MLKARSFKAALLLGLLGGAQVKVVDGRELGSSQVKKKAKARSFKAARLRLLQRRRAQVDKNTKNKGYRTTKKQICLGIGIVGVICTCAWYWVDPHKSSMSNEEAYLTFCEKNVNRFEKAYIKHREHPCRGEFPSSEAIFNRDGGLAKSLWINDKSDGCVISKEQFFQNNINKWKEKALWANFVIKDSKENPALTTWTAPVPILNRNHKSVRDKMMDFSKEGAERWRKAAGDAERVGRTIAGIPNLLRRTFQSVSSIKEAEERVKYWKEEIEWRKENAKMCLESARELEPYLDDHFESKISLDKQIRICPIEVMFHLNPPLGDWPEAISSMVASYLA